MDYDDEGKFDEIFAGETFEVTGRDADPRHGDLAQQINDCLAKQKASGKEFLFELAVLCAKAEQLPTLKGCKLPAGKRSMYAKLGQHEFFMQAGVRELLPGSLTVMYPLLWLSSVDAQKLVGNRINPKVSRDEAYLIRHDVTGMAVPKSSGYRLNVCFDSAEKREEARALLLEHYPDLRRGKSRV